jgi:hypothetical protein
MHEWITRPLYNCDQVRPDSTLRCMRVYVTLRKAAIYCSLYYNRHWVQQHSSHRFASAFRQFLQDGVGQSLKNGISGIDDFDETRQSRHVLLCLSFSRKAEDFLPETFLQTLHYLSLLFCTRSMHGERHCTRCFMWKLPS